MPIKHVIRIYLFNNCVLTTDFIKSSHIADSGGKENICKQKTEKIWELKGSVCTFVQIKGKSKVFHVL